jgi:hypothetical protein
MYRIVIALAAATLISGAVSITKAQSASAGLDIPAFTAYVEPDPEAMSVSERDGVTGWTDAAQKLVWYGYIKNRGTLTPIISFTLPSGSASTLRLTVAGVSSEADVTGAGP